MDSQYLTCPFCGFEFEKEDTLCAHGCPLGPLCRLIRCPSCAYEFPETPRGVSWFKRLMRMKPRQTQEVSEEFQTLRLLKSGTRAKVLCLGADRSSRHNTLATFGLVPGTVVTVLQQLPSCVIRVDETELALDPDIAREIVVESVAS